MSSRRALAAALLAALTVVTGCGDGAGSDDQVLSVYAAASLTAAFEDLADEFETDHEGVRVQLTFGGSSDLVAQIDQGAPADVLAAADEPTMKRLVDAGLTDGTPRTFATNTLQVAVPPDNPAGVTRLQDLARPGVQLVTCAPEVPCGAAAQELAEQAGVTLRPVSEEQSVSDVLGKVVAGEADAGLVYVTDVLAAGSAVTGIAVPEAREVVNAYPVAVVEGAAQARLAREFLDLVLSERGQAVLAEHGFGRP